MIKKDRYKHSLIELKWQDQWLKSGIYTPDINAKKKYYNLMMFPYPSAEGLHVGNMYAFTGADVNGRFKRMLGYDVFEPIGLDGFGIHSENYAIKEETHPKTNSKITEKKFYQQLMAIGNGFDWTRKLETYNPEYYRWTQWLFIKMYKKGLVYRDKANVNWCPSCKTVLADEQVEASCCERCKHEVNRREMASWYFRITDYSDLLLDGLTEIDWPNRIKTAQINWIGRSEGAEIKFKLDSNNTITVFTTRADTIMGATFLVLSPEVAKKYLEIVSEDNKKSISEYIEIALSKSEQQRKIEEKGKTGIDTGLTVINPANDKKIPVFVADYVLSGVGTGAVMGVPKDDERDKAFAQKHKLPIEESETSTKVLERLFKDGVASKQLLYHLRDWLVSRQRYWGPPIPMINCKKCGWQPVPEDQLPVVLPDINNFKPKGDGTSPLANAPESWKIVDCPKCGGKAERELDVSDTFLDSSWYFLAYPNLKTKAWKGKQTPFDKKITKNWFPVDAYTGGAEHAVLHLLYSRFITMALYDMGHVPFKEPFPFLYGHGLIIKDGAKMSKSQGNIVNPDIYIKKYGADTLRIYLMFIGPYDKGGDFNDAGIEGMSRFLKRIWNLFNVDSHAYAQNDNGDINIKTCLRRQVHQTIKKVTNDIEKFRYNTAISAIMEYVNLLRDKGTDKENLIILAQLIAPFAPHLSEEAWEMMGLEYSVHNSKWPKFDPELIKKDTVVYMIQINGKVRGEITALASEDKDVIISKAKQEASVIKWLDNKKIIKEIFVQNKIINFVVA